MKKILLGGAGFAALAILPALAIAQQGPAPHTRAAVQAKVEAHFNKADADRDGFVTQAEAQAARAAFRADRRENRAERRGERRAAVFARLDANGDGAISRAEFAARPAREPGAMAERRAHRMERRGGGHARMMGGGAMGRGFAMLDADKDGRVSRAEASTRALALFDRVDADHDGSISAEERRAAHQALRDRLSERSGN